MNAPLTVVSTGFLDGGDRSVLLDCRSNMPSPAPFEKRQFGSTSDSSDSSEGRDVDPSSLTTSFVPTSSLLVTNLPNPSVFSSPGPSSVVLSLWTY